MIEVKSRLDRAALETFSTNLAALGELERRFYRGPLIDHLGMLGAAEPPQHPASVSAKCSTLSALGVGPVAGFLLAFEAPSHDTISTYLEAAEYYRWFDFIYALGHGFWAVHHPQVRLRGEQAVLPFVQRLFECTMHQQQRWLYVRVDVERYMKSMFGVAIGRLGGTVPESIREGPGR